MADKKIGMQGGFGGLNLAGPAPVSGQKISEDKTAEDMNAKHHGAVCGECGRTVTNGEYSKGESNCCQYDVCSEEEYDTYPRKEAAAGEKSADMYEPKPGEEVVTADWRDTEGLIAGFRKALRNLGISMRQHPQTRGSDMYGFILSKRAAPVQAAEEKVAAAGTTLYVDMIDIASAISEIVESNGGEVIPGDATEPHILIARFDSPEAANNCSMMIQNSYSSDVANPGVAEEDAPVQASTEKEAVSVDPEHPEEALGNQAADAAVQAIANAMDENSPRGLSILEGDEFPVIYSAVEKMLKAGFKFTPEEVAFITWPEDENVPGGGDEDQYAAQLAKIPGFKELDAVLNSFYN